MTDEVQHGDRRETGWRINKEIPVSVLLVVLVQTISGMWYVAKLDARLTLLEERRQDDKLASSAMAQLPERLTRTEINLTTVVRSVERLEEKLDRRTVEERRLPNNDRLN